MNENGGGGELRNQLGICRAEIGNYLKRRDIAQQASSAYRPTASASRNDTAERKIKTCPAYKESPQTQTLLSIFCSHFPVGFQSQFSISRLRSGFT
ncbi:hypothetical protein V6N13_143192 [Hibiscus sabdariffa]|uniref:Uncharacterized protein n=1 Tax=Hibiscus sabdariffa TaxID=183260 RepID=A0ABR2FGU0_9ROSI